MLILGHAGITLGVATAVDAAFCKRHPSMTSVSRDSPGLRCRARTARFASLARHIDIRILLLGSLLPDIIDKPLGHLLFREVFSSGRIFGHTFLFLLVISLAGLWLYRVKKKNWLLVLSFGTFTHLVFDQMWLTPGTLLWPLFGWEFEKLVLDHWLRSMLVELLTEPGVYVTEIIGGAVLGIFGLGLLSQARLRSFVRTGRVA
jgi:inner membrane protein